jgi:hypothetical protein
MPKEIYTLLLDFAESLGLEIRRINEREELCQGEDYLPVLDVTFAEKHSSGFYALLDITNPTSP